MSPVLPLAVVLLVFITELSSCILNELEGLQYGARVRELSFPVEEQLKKTKAYHLKLQLKCDESEHYTLHHRHLPLEERTHPLVPMPFVSVPLTKGSVLVRSPVLPPPSPASPSSARTRWDFTSKMVSV